MEAEAASTIDAVAEGEFDRLDVEEAVILAGPLAEEEAEAEADPLDIDIDIDMEELELMVILDILELDDMEELDDIELADAEAEALAIAARLADPPPIVE